MNITGSNNPFKPVSSRVETPKVNGTLTRNLQFQAGPSNTIANNKPFVNLSEKAVQRSKATMSEMKQLNAMSSNISNAKRVSVKTSNQVASNPKASSAAQANNLSRGRAVSLLK